MLENTENTKTEHNPEETNNAKQNYPNLVTFYALGHKQVWAHLATQTVTEHSVEQVQMELDKTHTNLDELSFFTVFALPKASRIGLACSSCCSSSPCTQFTHSLTDELHKVPLGTLQGILETTRYLAISKLITSPCINYVKH